MISLALPLIRLDGGTQCRAKLDDEHIGSLAEAWAEGAKMPAVVVFHDGSNHWLADGFHRYHAAQKCAFRDILADVRSGTKLDALRFALSANAAHGLRRTNADKRRAVEIALKEFPKLSSREIAKVCAVGDQLVNRLRESRSSDARLGADGKTRKLPSRKDSSTAPSVNVSDETLVRLGISRADADRCIRTANLSEPEFTEYVKAEQTAAILNFPRREAAPFNFDEWKAQMRLTLSMGLRRVPKSLLADAERFLAAEVRVFSTETKHETAHQSVS